MAVRDKIAKDEICGARLICLDLEFSPSTGKVFEIGGCEYYSGKIFIDTKIKHDCSSSELHKSQDLKIPTDPFSELISKRASVRVLWRDKMGVPSQCTIVRTEGRSA